MTLATLKYSLGAIAALGMSISCVVGPGEDSSSHACVSAVISVHHWPGWEIVPVARGGLE
jgi:hypothetical protein